jgi:2-amino-4-hydroxy-6-hydroxymethyldihydropteridine diphosphokinase
MSSPNPHAIDADTLSGMKPLTKVDVIVVDVSSVYESDAVGGPAGSPTFLNLVIVAETTLEPRTLLERAQAIEDAFGRVREEHWAPRTLDVDLIMVGKTQIDQPDLKLPHPLAHQRAFVLAPWAEIDPRGSLIGRGSVADLVTALDLSSAVRRDDLQIEGD